MTLFLRKSLSLVMAVMLLCIAPPQVFAKDNAECDSSDKLLRSDGTMESDNLYSQGLTYTLSNDSTGYIVTGIGTCTDSNIVFPDTYNGLPVIGIGSNSFSGCSNLTSITIPDSIKSIGVCAFVNCHSLTNVAIGNGVTYIEQYAFQNCSNLTAITIPDSVTEIDTEAFSGCENISDVYISDVGAWCSIQFTDTMANPLNYAENLYLNGTLVTDLEIPDNVEEIENYAFYGFSNLTGVTITDNVKSIGASAFASCTNLSAVDLGNGVVDIGSGAFADCISLESIIIPEGVKKIDCFSGCSKLKRVVLPNSILDITRNAFADCPVQTKMFNDAYYLGNDENPYLVLVQGGPTNDISRIIHEDTKVIAGGAFMYRKLRSIDIPASVVSICEYAFYGCDSLPTVSGAENVQYIGESAFAKSALTSFTIPEGVTIIPYMAFDDCRQLSEVIIPNGVTEIGTYAFGTCDSLKNIVLPEGLITIGSRAFDGCTGITEIEIPGSVTEIGIYAFSRCQFLTTVALSEGLTRIGNGAFEECYNLINIQIPDSVTFIGNSAFSSCRSLSSLEIPQGVQNIYSSTFERCNNLKTIVIPVSVTAIDRWAFHYCSSLETVYYTGSQEQKAKISIAWDGNDYLRSAEWIYDYSTIHTCRYSDWNMTIAPTFQSEGKRERVCSECGNIEEEVIPIAVANIVSWNLKLENDIQVNFYLEISESIESTARVRIYVGEEGFTHCVSKLDKTEEGLYIASVNIAAAQMSDYIFVTVLNGNDISSTMSYTVRQYADTILANESYSKYHTLVKEMLNYGAAAQVYFDYETDNLANKGITGTGNVEIPDSVDDTLSVDGKANGIAFYGASLIFRDRIAVRYYFSFEGQINNMTFAVNDQQYAPQLKDGLYFIEIADILPQNLDQQITLTVTDADGSVLTVTYGPMNYIVRMNEKGSDTLKALVKALYNYHLAAKALSA